MIECSKLLKSLVFLFYSFINYIIFRIFCDSVKKGTWNKLSAKDVIHIMWIQNGVANIKNPLMVYFQLVSFKLIKATFSDKNDVKMLMIDSEANQLARKHFWRHCDQQISLLSVKWKTNQRQMKTGINGF